MKKLTMITMIILMIAGPTTGLYADSGIEIFKKIPEEGTYSEIGELRLPSNEVGDDAFMAKLTKQAMEMGANGIIMFDKPVPGESLVMTDKRMVTVGVAIKYQLRQGR